MAKTVFLKLDINVTYAHGDGQGQDRMSVNQAELIFQLLDIY